MPSPETDGMAFAGRALNCVSDGFEVTVYVSPARSLLDGTIMPLAASMLTDVPLTCAGLCR